MSSTHARAIRGTSQPVSDTGPENPKPGSDGITTWNASAATRRRGGSVSGPTRSTNSATDPGQPCVSRSGTASGPADRTCRKWMRCPSISVVNCGNALSAASCARQS